MHLGVDFLGFILFGVAQLLDLYVVSFTKLGALSSITSSNRFSAPLFPLCLGTLMIRMLDILLLSYRPLRLWLSFLMVLSRYW